MPHYIDVLIQNGEFRLVRGKENISDTIIQHHCDNPHKTSDYLCDPDNNWWYCWNVEQTCTGCGMTTPLEMRGFREMYEWER